LSSHLFAVHSGETEVTELLETNPSVSDNADTAKSKADKRKVLFELIRNKGNFRHNEKVLKEKEGSLILVRRTNLHMDHVPDV